MLFQVNFDDFQKFIFHNCFIYFGGAEVGETMGDNMCISDNNITLYDRESLFDSYKSKLEVYHCDLCSQTIGCCYGIGTPNPIFFSLSVLMHVEDTGVTQGDYLLKNDHGYNADFHCSAGSLMDQDWNICVSHPCPVGYSFMNHSCFR